MNNLKLKLIAIEYEASQYYQSTDIILVMALLNVGKNTIYISRLDSSSSIINLNGFEQGLYDLDISAYQRKRLKPESALVTHIYLNEVFARKFTSTHRILLNIVCESHMSNLAFQLKEKEIAYIQNLLKLKTPTWVEIPRVEKLLSNDEVKSEIAKFESRVENQNIDDTDEPGYTDDSIDPFRYVIYLIFIIYVLSMLTAC